VLVVLFLAASLAAGCSGVTATIQSTNPPPQTQTYSISGTVAPAAGGSDTVTLAVGGDAVTLAVARVVIAACFAALVLHTFAYADFLEDPMTWTLLGIGVARVRASPAAEPREQRRAAADDGAVAALAPE